MGKDGLPSSFNIFLLLFFFLPGDASPVSPVTEPQYMVLLPFLINTDAPEKVCVQLTHLNESVTLSATLEYQGQNRSLIDDVVSEKDIFTCIPFSIPKLSIQSPVIFLTVRVKGETLQFISRKTVSIKNFESLVFVQTDKPIYKPGQTVLFRIVSLDESFHPVNEVFPLVYIEDPKKNRLYQWTEAELKGGLIQLFFNLTSEPIQGTYSVVVQKASGNRIQHSFSVEEYVLPKFEVMVKMPKVITILDEKLKVTVCGLYTFGKPVPGLVTFRVCRKFQYSSACYGEESKAVCEEFSGQTDNHGCISEVVKTKLFQLKRTGYEDKLHVEAKIKEEETGVVLTGTSFSKITNTISKITFEDSDSHYKPGIPFFGQVKLVDGSGAPIANETVRISLQGGQETNYTTNEEGKAQFALNTSMLELESVGIRATHKSYSRCFDHSLVFPHYEEGHLFIKRFYSPSKSFLKIEPKSEMLSCGSPTEVRVHYILTPKAVGEERKIVFYYLVMAKGIIKQSGTSILDLDQESANGVFLLQLPVEADIAPVAQVLVYTTTPSREVIADSAKFNVEKCFSNKVDLSFSPSEGLPSSETHLLFKASPNSLCAVRAVDKSVLLMKPEADLSPGSVEFSVSAEALQNQQPCGNAIVETPEKGRKDTVIRQLLVEPEGVEKETVQNSVLCAKGKSLQEKFSLSLPSNVVQDSGRAYFSVLGDIMGTAMQNLHQLLQLPFGCGEQNMVLFAPNIYVLDYLNKTGQLSEEIKSKAIGYLVSGYQRQLNYKHADGSYSTFGQRYGQPGNTWLTAFVLKSFAQARPHIYIDERHIQDALNWLASKQKDNGCFLSSGTLLNNAMKGGVDNEVSLTAYITIALLEIPLPVTHSVLNHETLSFSFTVERDIPVQGLKPAQVKVYDYYETDEFATQEYSAPCTTDETEEGNA
ncbi:Alpha-2-macroglobulin [Aix galericulata]|nr:Alpha-2-macroglobulin [Aix galericulata]